MPRTKALSRNQRSLRRRYAYLRLCHRCVKCTGRLPDGWLKARCRTCGSRNQKARDDGRMQRARPGAGCPRCHLRGRHECLPPIYAFAIRRRAADIL